ncbi:tail fiber protein [Staphylococcus phage Alsa_3]|nr:tail fiber protein [Staphylococcus phage Alsa_3]WNM51132.1 tail fiber protein [Staphylococcus phage Alsa_4]
MVIRKITQDDDVKFLTETVNQLVDSNNTNSTTAQTINDLSRTLDNYQKFKVTSDSGLAKPINFYTSVLRNVKQTGFYMISYSNVSNYNDIPKNFPTNTNMLLQVMPTNYSNAYVQQLFSIDTNSYNVKSAYRFVFSSSSSEWIVNQGLINGKNRVIMNDSLSSITEPGSYYIYNTRDLPKGHTTGFIDIINTERTIMYRFVSEKDSSEHIKIGTNGEWVSVTGYNKDTIFNVIPGKLKDIETWNLSFDVLVYKSDNKSFYDAIFDAVVSSNKHIITFYCQGGVTDSPGGTMSSRGIFITDTNNISNNELSRLHGIYIGSTTMGDAFSGGVSSGNFKQFGVNPTHKTLWEGSAIWTDKNTVRDLADDISNYTHFEVYVTMRSTEKNNGTDKVGTKVHKFYLDNSPTYVVSGTLLSGVFDESKKIVPTLEYYRVGVSLSGKTWKITDSLAQNDKSQYITRIVGVREPH